MTVTIPAGSLMESALTGQACLDSLLDHEVLTSAATALLAAVADAGDVAVRPVSRNGTLIVGAAAMLSRGAIRQAPPGTLTGEHTKVLLVEAVVVGHGTVERAVRQARIDGAEWVNVWVWRGSPPLTTNATSADDITVDGAVG